MFSLFGKVEAKYEKLFFDLSIKSINGEELNLKQFKGKTILIVNVASKCGFTKQYNGLQTLYEKYLATIFSISYLIFPIGFFEPAISQCLHHIVCQISHQLYCFEMISNSYSVRTLNKLA